MLRVTRILAVGLLLAASPYVWAEEDPTADAEDAARRGHWQAALHRYLHAVEADASSARAVRGLARSVLATGREDLFERAVGLLDTAIATRPGDFGARLLRGRLMAWRGEDAEAYLAALQADIGKVLEAAPASAAAMLWRGRVLYRRAMVARSARRYAQATDLLGQARDALRTAAAAAPQDYDGWYALGVTSRALGDRKTALEAFEKAALARPSEIAPLEHLSSLLRQEASGVYERTLLRITRTAKGHPQATLFLALLRVQDTHYEAADALFEQLADADPRNAEARYQRGLALQHIGFEDEALEQFRAALAVDPDHDLAAEELDNRLFEVARQRASTGIPGTAAAIASYEPLFALAKHNPYPRQNLAFALRAAWRAHKVQAKALPTATGAAAAKATAEREAWHGVLRTCAALYEESSALLARRLERRGDRAPRGKAYGYAQILCDTGSLFHDNEAIRDLAKAEAYLQRSLEVAPYAYYDTWQFLRRLYTQQERWGDLAMLAAGCATLLMQERTLDGRDTLEPHEAGRAEAAAVRAGVDKAKLSADELFAVAELQYNPLGPRRRRDFAGAVPFYDYLLTPPADSEPTQGGGAAATRATLAPAKRAIALEHLGWARRRLEDHQAAYEAFTRLVALHGKASAAGAAAALEQARSLADLGRLVEARAGLGAVAEMPAAERDVTLRARLAAARLSVALGEIAAGRAALETLVEELAADDARSSRYVRARARAELGKLKAKPKPK